MRYLFPTIALLVSGLITQPTLALPIPMADVPAMAQASDLIAVGRASQTSGQAGGGHVRFVVSVDRVLKAAGPSAARRIVVELDLSSAGAAPVAERQYGIFFLRGQTNGSSFVPTDPFHPALFASPARTRSQDKFTDVLISLTHELAGVLTTSTAALTDPVNGVHDTAFTAAADQAQDIYFQAASALATIPYAVTSPTLHLIAASNQLPARLWAMFSLFAMADFNDESAKADYLKAVAPTLVNPRPDLAVAVSSLGSVMEGRVRSPSALPTLALLLGSTEVAVRRAAASALSKIGTRDVVKPLGRVALNDDDELVRLFAVQGLAKATGAGQVPSLATFRRDQSGTVHFWQDWMATNIREP